MFNNEYSNITELIKDYYNAPVGTYLNQSISINNVILICDIYRVANGTVLTGSIFSGCVENDANTQIIIGKNMSVATGTTLIPPYRCKGIIIGDIGTFTNEGTISMTARGASGEGKNIQLTNDYMISAVGGSGGIKTGSSGNGVAGNSPSTGVLSCGGGGSGSSSTSSYNGGAGGSGTSFSGGAGGGGSLHQAGNSGSSSGGAGGAATTYQVQFCAVSGGAGNPPGINFSPGGDSREILTTSGDGYTAGTGNGTGGLLIIISNNIISSGSFLSEGVMNQLAYCSRSDYVGRGENGGASGGGCIVLLSKSNDISGTYSVNGGSSATIDASKASQLHMHAYFGGAGGAGVYASYIVPDLILQDLPVEIAISDTNHLENIEPSEGVRLLGMMDDNELYYDIMGTRHRAVDDTGALDLSRIIPPGQRTPDGFEVDITDPQEGQVIKYNAINEQWENGEIDTKHVYSTDEHVVGTWINGKPVYEKTIEGNNFNSTGDWSANHNISNLDEVVNVSSPLWFDSIDDCWIGDSRMYFSGSKSSSYGVGGKIQITSTRISILQESGFAAVDWTNRTEKIRITIQYTKTTDTAQS